MNSFASIRSWVLGLADHVTVLEPPSFRDELVEWLTALADGGAGVGGDDDGDGRAEKVVAAAG